MSKLKTNLKDLKAKLENIQAQIEEQTSSKLIKEKRYKSIDEKISEVLDKNKEIMKLNIGGKIFSTTKENLLKDQNSIFSIMIKEDPSVNELFFDRNPRLFHTILNYIRLGKIDYSKFTKEDLLELYHEALFYEIEDIREFLENKTKEIKVIKMNFSGEYIFKGKIIGDNRHDSILDENMMTGICAKSPGWIEFELNSLWEFDEIKLGGYKGNSNSWYSGNGAGAQVLVSENGKDYKKIGIVPSKFGVEPVSIKFDQTQSGKFIKFTHSSYLGLGYFYIEKMSN